MDRNSQALSDISNRRLRKTVYSNCNEGLRISEITDGNEELIHQSSNLSEQSLNIKHPWSENSRDTSKVKISNFLTLEEHKRAIVSAKQPNFMVPTVFQKRPNENQDASQQFWDTKKFNGPNYIPNREYRFEKGKYNSYNNRKFNDGCNAGANKKKEYYDALQSELSIMSSNAQVLRDVSNRPTVYSNYNEGLQISEITDGNEESIDQSSNLNKESLNIKHPWSENSRDTSNVKISNFLTLEEHKRAIVLAKQSNSLDSLVPTVFHKRPNQNENASQQFCDAKKFNEPNVSHNDYRFEEKKYNSFNNRKSNEEYNNEYNDECNAEYNDQYNVEYNDGNNYSKEYYDTLQELYDVDPFLPESEQNAKISLFRKLRSMHLDAEYDYDEVLSINASNRKKKQFEDNIIITKHYNFSLDGMEEADKENKKQIPPPEKSDLECRKDNIDFDENAIVMPNLSNELKSQDVSLGARISNVLREMSRPNPIKYMKPNFGCEKPPSCNELVKYAKPTSYIDHILDALPNPIDLHGRPVKSQNPTYNICVQRRCGINNMTGKPRYLLQGEGKNETQKTCTKVAVLSFRKSDYENFLYAQHGGKAKKLKTPKSSNEINFNQFTEGFKFESTVCYISIYSSLTFYISTISYELSELNALYGMAKILDMPKENTLYAVELKERKSSVFRCMILPESTIDKGNKLHLKLFDLDEIIEMTEDCTLYTLPEKFRYIPPQAIKCFLASIANQDDHRSLSNILKTLLNQLACFKVIKRVGDLLHVELLDYGEELYDRYSSARANFKFQRSNNLTYWIKLLCNPYQDNPVLRDTIPDQTNQIGKKTDDKIPIHISVTYIVSIEFFFGIATATAPYFLPYDCITKDLLFTSAPSLSQMVLAKYDDENWYRGIIISVDHETGIYKIFFMDFGNPELVEFENMCLCPSEFLDKPPLALFFQNVSIRNICGSNYIRQQQGEELVELNLKDKTIRVSPIQIKNEVHLVEFVDEEQLKLNRTLERLGMVEII